MKLFKYLSVIIMAIALFCLNGCDLFKSKEMKNAKTCIKLEQYNEAIKHLAKEIENNPDNADAYCLLGEVLITTEKIKEALKAFEYAIKLEETSNERISLFCFERARQLVELEVLPTNQIMFLFKYAKQINPSSFETQKKLLQEFAGIRLDKFEDVRNARIFLLSLCTFDKSYGKSTGELLYNFGIKHSGDKKIIAFSGALPYNQEHKQEIALFIIESAKATNDAFLYDFIRKECQKDAELSFDKELADAKKTIVEKLLSRAKMARYNDARDIKNTKQVFAALHIITKPDQPYQRQHLLIRKNETKQITIFPFTLSQEIICRNYVKYRIKTEKPIYLIYSGHFGTCKIVLVEQEYIFDKFCPNPQKLAFLSPDNANIQIMKEY